VIRLAERGTVPGARHGDREDGPDGPVEHVSPGLKAIADGLNPDLEYRFLDLGPAVPANIDYFSRYASHIRIADAVEDLRSIVPDEENPDLLVDLVGQALPLKPLEFDVVMAWDLLSYLNAEVVEATMDRLQVACRPGGKVLLLIHSGTTMPAAPQVFEIQSNNTINYRLTTSAVTDTRDVPPAEVERLLDGFRVESSFVLRHGIREYVAVRL